MTAPELPHAPEADAVGAPVEQPVRPRAWIGPVWQLMNDSIYEAWAKKYPDDARHYAPLYDQATLDAAVAAERERWTLLLAEKWHAGHGMGQTLAQYMGMTDAEYASWVVRA